MRLLVQRVKEASVDVDRGQIGFISSGFLIFLGISKSDTEDQVQYLVDKIINFRVFPDVFDKMNLSIKDVSGEILIISQFTLYADTSKGRRPSFVNAMDPEKAEIFYNLFISEIKKYVKNVGSGIFGAKMQIKLINDGPLTFIIDSK